VRRLRWYGWLAAVVLAVGVLWAFRVRLMAAAYARPPVSVDEVWGLVWREDVYVSKGSNAERRAVQAMLTAVDPYAYYVPPEDAALVKSERPSGALVAVEGARLVVREVWPGSGAAAGGLRPGDQVIAVAGRAVGAPPDRFERLALDWLPAQGEREVTVVRDGRRQRLRLRYRPFPPQEAVFGGVAYIRPFLWLRGQGRAFREAVCRRKEARLVVDLRGNGGGDPAEAAEGLSAFLPAGARVARMVDRNGRVILRVVTEKAPCYRGKVAVLVDGETASASEMFAGALQRAGRAVLVGRRTYGKGVWQGELRLWGGGGFLMLTRGRWYFADGSNLDGEGLKPDVDWEGEAWEEALRRIPGW